MLEQLTQPGQEGHVTAARIALVYAALGDKDQAFGMLQKALDERSGALVYLKVEPRFEMLRTDPRYDALLRRIGLTP